jgi:hypothetical protein
MRKHSLALLGIIVLLGLTCLAQDQTPAQNTTKVRSGQVVAVDAARNEITIKDGTGTESRLMISSDTKIMKGGKAIGLADVKAGDTVTCDCDESAGGCKARSITVSAPKPE